MSSFEWSRMLLNDLPTSFLLEVVFRVLFAYLTVFLFIKASGRRGIRQLSVFELVVILMLGSAAGDVTMYDDVPLLPVAMVFLALMVAYRITTYFLCRSATFSVWIEGAPITLVRNGEYEISSLDCLNITEEEFFMEFRQAGVEHLGQIRLAIVEVSGMVSIYYFEDKDVRPGLSVLPDEHRHDCTVVPSSGLYACNHCGHVERIEENESRECPRCKETLWSQALNSPRMT